MKTDAREQILNTAVQMLRDGRDPAFLTVREIAAEANVQLSLINYYFRSKDDLLYRAVGVLRDKVAWEKLSSKGGKQDPYLRLREILVSICEMSVKYSQYMKFTVEYELTKAEIVIPNYLIPLIREICKNKISETGIKIMAYQIIVTLQLIFLRDKDLSSYLGFDVLDHNGIEEVIDSVLTNCFPKH